MAAHASALDAIYPECWCGCPILAPPMLTKMNVRVLLAMTELAQSWGYAWECDLLGPFQRKPLRVKRSSETRP